LKKYFFLLIFIEYVNYFIFNTSILKEDLKAQTIASYIDGKNKLKNQNVTVQLSRASL